MSHRTKYHAHLDFGYNNPQVRFTAVDLERLMTRFTLEVLREQQRRTAAHEYTYVEPSLIVEVCDSWSEFDRHEHCDGKVRNPVRKQLQDSIAGSATV